MNIKYKKSIFLLLCMLSVINAKAQDLYYTRKYYINPVLINPAITGSDYIPKIIMFYDKQFLGINNSPETYFISGQLRIGKYDFYNPEQFINKSKFRSLERLGLGSGIYIDKDGPLTNLMINMTYSYHIPINDNSELSLGLSGNIYNYRLHSTEFEPYHLDDPLLNVYPEKRTVFNSGFGVYYTNKVLFAGFSLKNMLPVKDGLDKKKNQPTDIYFLTGYLLNADSNPFHFEPSLVVKKESIHTKIIADIHMKFYYKNNFWFSISYRDYQNLNLLLVFKTYKSVCIGYSYENVLGKVGKYSFGSHGIICGINLGL